MDPTLLEFLMRLDPSNLPLILLFMFAFEVWKYLNKNDDDEPDQEIEKPQTEPAG